MPVNPIDPRVLLVDIDQPESYDSVPKRLAGDSLQDNTGRLEDEYILVRETLNHLHCTVQHIGFNESDLLSMFQRKPFLTEIK